jgi:replicative DNA helicase
MKRQFNLSLLVIDYLQLLRGHNAKESNRVQEIGEISQGLKAIAKELDIPVIALSQLSRAVESRDDKRPQLSDLRDSGNIEQDADIVMFIFREEYYLSRKMPTVGTDEYSKWQQEMDRAANIADVIIAKQRNGPIGNVSLMFNTKTTGFSNLERSNATYMKS